jgi:hypothetical protein
MSVTATETTTRTWVTVWPYGFRRPYLADLSAPGLGTAENLVVVRNGTGGKVSLFNSAGSTQLVGDIVGYYR